MLEITYPKTELNPTGAPLPTQKLFHQSKAKERVFAGGWGCGKTTTIVLEIAKDIAMPDNFILLGRLDMEELKSTTLEEFLNVYDDIIVEHNKQDKIIRFPNGSRVYYTNLDEGKGAVRRIASLNLGAVVLDQMEEISESVYIALLGRLRRKNARRCIYGAINPNGHDWIFNRFIKEKNKDREIFITSTLENKYLPQDYIDTLKKMPQNWQKRYIYASFDEWVGMVYDNYIESIHKIPPYIPLMEENHYIVLDYGYRNPTAILWISVDYDGIIRVWDEFYKSEMLIRDLAYIIKTRHPEIYNRATLLIDPSAYANRTDGKSIVDTFIENGVYFLPANNILLQGINAVNTLFKENRLFICSNCTNTLNEIANYRWKEINRSLKLNYVEEPLKKDDHAMDCIRYFANYIDTPIRKETVKIPKWVEKIRRKAKEIYKGYSFMGV